ncbi:NAD(P)H-dependent glycerol-3-phosphate dehydrogenase [Anatilimnocola aggregata]|nr:NAD(P)H-dependent glycerol-3-phosphate dehydrogenase [Anatilimnocola aggregata]
MTRIKIAVLGAGSIGTAMAHVLASNGHDVAIWDFFPEVVEDIRLHRENRRFLPSVRLHGGVRATCYAGECVTDAALVVVGVPSLFVSSTLAPVVPALLKSAVLLNLAKGFAPRTRQLPSILMERLSPGHSCVHLAGPAIANELARGLPAAVVLAAKDDPIARRVANWLAGPAFSVTTTTDVAGAALGGVLKNVYAILLGCLETLSGGSRNVEAAALNASIHEMAAIARAHGGRASTLYGLAGLGDLVATGFSRDSHNRKFGQSLAAGKTAAEIATEMCTLPEGARAATAACALARDGQVRAPLAKLVRRWIMGASPSLDDLIRVLQTARRTK